MTLSHSQGLVLMYDNTVIYEAGGVQFQHAPQTAGGLVKNTGCCRPQASFLIQEDQDGARESASLNFQVMLVLLGLYFENQ